MVGGCKGDGRFSGGFVIFGAIVCGGAFFKSPEFLPLTGMSRSPERCVPGERGEEMTGEEIISRSLPFDFPYFWDVRGRGRGITPEPLTKRERMICTTDLSLSMKLASEFSFFFVEKKPIVRWVSAYQIGSWHTEKDLRGYSRTGKGRQVDQLLVYRPSSLYRRQRRRWLQFT